MKRYLSVFFCCLSIVMTCVAAKADEVSQTSEQKSAQLLMWNVPKSGKAALLPDISLIGSVVGAYFRDDPGGDQGENPAVTGFNFQGVELAIQSAVDAYVRADVFLHFAEDAVELEQAEVTTLGLPAGLQVKAGKLLASFGRENTKHLEQLNFVDGAPSQRYFFGNEGFKELGAEVSVLLPLPWYSQVGFQVLQGDNPGNFDGTRKGDLAYVGHLTNSVDLSKDLTLQSGFSSAFGFNATGPGNWTQLYGADLYLRWRPSQSRGIKWQNEYTVRRLETVNGVLTDGGIDSQLIYQFAKRWESGVRFDWIGIPNSNFSQHALGSVLTFNATEFFKVRAQYNYIDADTFRTGHEAFLQMQFNMGAHGAHAF